MQINWSTLILEVINFLVLMWILKRIFYIPIKEAIEKRKEVIQQSLDKARQVDDEAKKLMAQYETRLSDWEKEKRQKELTLKQDLEDEKNQALEHLRTTLGKEREKNQAQESKRLQAIILKEERLAEVRATKLAAKLLERLVGPEMENKIIELFIEQIIGISQEKIILIKNELVNNAGVIIKIVSAFPIEDQQRKNLSSTIKKLFDQVDLKFNFTQDGKLLAGLCVAIGSIIIHADIHDELKFFSEIPFHE